MLRADGAGDGVGAGRPLGLRGLARFGRIWGCSLVCSNTPVSLWSSPLNNVPAWRLRPLLTIALIYTVNDLSPSINSYPLLPYASARASHHVHLLNLAHDIHYVNICHQNIHAPLSPYMCITEYTKPSPSSSLRAPGQSLHLAIHTAHASCSFFSYIRERVSTRVCARGPYILPITCPLDAAHHYQSTHPSQA